MGQKTNPRGFRLAVRKNWRSSWYASKKEFGDLLLEDKKLRDALIAKPVCQGTSEILIRRMSDKVEVTIVTSRPGLVIGKKGSDIDQLKNELSKLIAKDVWVEVQEIKRPDIDAKVIADGIAKQLERRIQFRRAMKTAIQKAMDSGALGIKIQVAGRIGGAEIARTEWYKEGSTPLHTLRANIQYDTSRAETTYGSLGIKVWVYHGDIQLGKKEAA
jgi:small subunit ribosomal protein S3